MENLTIILLLLVVVILIVILFLTINTKNNLISKIQETQEIQINNSDSNSQTQTLQILKLTEMQNEQTNKLLTSNNDFQNKISNNIFLMFREIQNSNEKKLNEIEQTVNEKLDKTLNQRLDSNFKQIGDQLGDLYRTLGELNKLSTGVNNLNKTLSNVKTRGTWGERQLISILEQTMVSSQYDLNISTKKKSNDKVEVAIKIPEKDNPNNFLHLPIDSKMPSDIYNKIVDASAESNSEMLNAATKELEQRIKTEAKTIKDKYLDPPNTTDFAIMFLPTEGLYAEVLRINGLAEWCQTNCNIIISGPSTITALLNSLRLGFSNMALDKKSKEVLKLLQAIKTQYATLSELIDKTQKKLLDATSATEKLKERTNMIQRKMSKIEELDLSEASELLELDSEEM